MKQLQKMSGTPDTPANPPSSPAPGGIESVIAGGYCVGCGGCAVLPDSPCQMKLNDRGLFEAVLDDGNHPSAALHAANQVCPFTDQSLDEDALGRDLFAGDTAQQHEALGFHQASYAAHVTEGSYRTNGSSGGMGSWLQCELLEQGLADHVINVKPAAKNPPGELLFHYTICSTADDVRRSAKSRYYPIELSEVMRQVRERPGRYVFVGLPCFVKTARLLCRQDAVLAERLTWFVGLVCGHLKSKRFAEFLSWQVGVPPGALEDFNFRKKIPDLPADQYGVEATGTVAGQRITRVREVRELDGCDWGRGYFKYKACDYCDDVLAETADVVVGDAWLPRFAADWQGTNIVVTRHPTIDALVRTARDEGRLCAEEISAEDAAQTQNAGLRHRRDGLRYRLHLTARRGEWHPRKRVSPSKSHLSRWDRKRHRLREAIRDLSHRAFAQALADDDLGAFRRAMSRLGDQYDRMNAPSRWGAVRRLLKRLIPRR